jgi:alkylated DNA nucleotide flippase Atl1
MPIEVRPTGMASLYGQLGKLVGQAEAAREAEKQLLRIDEQLRNQAFQREMAEFDAQLNIDSQKRARVWELEKAEMSSRIDFEREERRRQVKLDERDAKMDALDRALNDGIIDESDYNTARIQIETGVPAYTQAKMAERGAGTSAKEQLTAHIAQLLGGQTVAEGVTTEPPVAATPTGQPVSPDFERIRVRTPEGETGTIEQWEWPIYERQGWSLAPAEIKPKKKTRQEYGRWAPSDDYLRQFGIGGGAGGSF